MAGSRFCAQKTTSGGLCVPLPHPLPAIPFPDPSCPVLAPSILDGAGVHYLADPRGAASCLGPQGLQINIPQSPVLPACVGTRLQWSPLAAPPPAYQWGCGCTTAAEDPASPLLLWQRQPHRDPGGESPRLSPWLLCRGSDGEASIAGGSSSPSRVICWEPGALGPLPFLDGRAGIRLPQPWSCRERQVGLSTSWPSDQAPQAKPALLEEEITLQPAWGPAGVFPGAGDTRSWLLAPCRHPAFAHRTGPSTSERASVVSQGLSSWCWSRTWVGRESE